MPSLPPSELPPSQPGPVEAAIGQETEGLPLAAARPALVETALALARNVLDNPRAVSSHAAAARVLARLLDELRKGAGRGRGGLKVVRAMTDKGGA